MPGRSAQRIDRRGDAALACRRLLRLGDAANDLFASRGRESVERCAQAVRIERRREVVRHRDLALCGVQIDGCLDGVADLDAELGARGLEQRMSPCLVPCDSPLGQLEGGTNMVVIEGDAVGQLVLRGAGAGQGPTASAVLSDIVEIARGVRLPVFGQPATGLRSAHPARTAVPAAYYLRLTLADKPGALAKVATVLLPATSWAEMDGTYVNGKGLAQRSERAIPPQGDSQPAWQWVVALAQALGHRLGFTKLSELRRGLGGAPTAALPAAGPANGATV